MNDEAALRDKLRKIEALFSGAGTAGEKAAAGAAADRIRARPREEEKREKSIEIRFSLADPWSRHMFIALCRRYGLRPYRYPRMRRQSVMVSGARDVPEHGPVAGVPGDQRRAYRISGPGHRQGNPQRGLQGHWRCRRGTGAGENRT